jgi:hypothetical protein
LRRTTLWLPHHAREVLDGRQPGDYPETGLEEINGDFPEADFSPGVNFRFACLGRLRSLEAVPVYAQLPYFRVECLSGDSQLNGGAGWTPNHAFGLPESGFEDLSFMFDEVSNQRSSRRRFGSHVREPGLIYKESLPFRQNHRPLDYILQLADVARPIVCVEEFDRLLVYVSNLLANFLA